MSFYGPVLKLKNVQEKLKMRFKANVLSQKSKKRSFIILEQKEVIETSRVDYTPFITSIYRLF